MVMTANGVAGSNIVTSTTGIGAWSPLTAGNCPMAVVNHAAFGGSGHSIITGSSGANGLFVGNAAGTTCTAVSAGTFSVSNDVDFSPTLAVWNVVGSGTNTIAYSTDDAVTFVGLGTSIFSTSGNAVQSASSINSRRRRKRQFLKLIQEFRNSTK
jgi:hypothetical protein